MRTVLSTIFTLVVGLFLQVAASRAQEPPELITDRPDATESSAVIRRGYVQLETGWLRSSDDDAGIELREAPGTLVRIGLSERFELRLGWQGTVRERQREGGARTLASGTGDGELGFKVHLFDAGGNRPQGALLLSSSLPFGDGEVTSDRFDPAFRFALEWDLPGRYAFGTNLGMAWSSAAAGTGDPATLAEIEYTATLGVDLAGPLGGFAELFGAIPIGFTGGDGAPAHSLAAGLTLLVLPNLQLDFYGGVGVSAAADDAFLGAGLSWRLPR